MNQARLSERVVDRVTQEAERDPHRWLPVSDLAAELIGESPTDSQLGVLASVLFRLATDAVLEVADFHRRRPETTRLGAPVGPYDQTAYLLTGGTSKPLAATGPREFGVRLAPA
jgi:hypothetical protein